MVRLASHSRFASHAQSPQTPAAVSGHTVDQHAVLMEASERACSRPPRSHPSALLLLAALGPVAGAEVKHTQQRVVDLLCLGDHAALAFDRNFHARTS